MQCYARYLFFIVVALLGLGQILTACGQKGPLYPPDQTPEEAIDMPAADEATDELPARR